MDPSKSGRGASSTFRLNGRIVSKEEYEDAMAAKQPQRQPKFLEQDVEWKGGLVQRRETEAAQQALQREVRIVDWRPVVAKIFAPHPRRRN